MSYKWQNDKTIFLKTTEDLSLVSQIPTDCSDKIFYEYLHSEFLKGFRNFFSFEKKSTLIKYNYYNWSDQKYRNFMTDMMMCLEPRMEPSKTIIIYELEEFNEVLFFNKGCIDIGFELNRKRKFVMRKMNSIVIADHGCTFNH